MHAIISAKQSIHAHKIRRSKQHITRAATQTQDQGCYLDAVVSKPEVHIKPYDEHGSTASIFIIQVDKEIYLLE